MRTLSEEIWATGKSKRSRQEKQPSASIFPLIFAQASKKGSLNTDSHMSAFVHLSMARLLLCAIRGIKYDSSHLCHRRMRHRAVGLSECMRKLESVKCLRPHQSDFRPSSQRTSSEFRNENGMLTSNFNAQNILCRCIRIQTAAC